MINLPKFSIFMTMALFACLSNSALGVDGAEFLKLSGYVAAEHEARVLNKDELAELARVRARLPSTKIVSIDFDAFNSTIVSATMPNGVQIRYVGKRTTTNDGTDYWSWSGDSASGHMAASAIGRTISIEIHDQGSAFKIETINSNFQILSLYLKYKEVDDSPPVNRHMERVPLNHPKVRPAAHPTTAAPTEIRVFTVWSPGATNGKSASALNVATKQRVDEVNNSFTRSKIGNVTVVNAGYMLSTNTFLDVRDPCATVHEIPFDYQIAKGRDDALADGVVLIVNQAIVPGVESTLGCAYTIGANSGFEAFAVVDTYGFDRYSYPHEFGHIIGARHQQANGNPSSGNDTDSTTPY